jgi:hypothetical protein
MTSSTPVGVSVTLELVVSLTSWEGARSVKKIVSELTDMLELYSEKLGYSPPLCIEFRGAQITPSPLTPNPQEEPS